MTEQVMGVVGLLLGAGAVVGFVVIPLVLRQRERTRPPGPLTLPEVTLAVSRLEPLSVNERGAALEPLNGQRVRWQAAYVSLMPMRGQAARVTLTGRPEEDLRFTISVGALQRGTFDELRPGAPLIIEGTLRIHPGAPSVSLDNVKLERAS